MKFYAKQVKKLVCVDSFGKLEKRPFILFYKTEKEETKEGFKTSAKAKKILNNENYNQDQVYCLSEEQFNYNSK